jgi:hypothetical protein
MGIRQLCCGRTEEPHNLEAVKIINPVFEINLKEKIKSLSFANSYKSGKHSLKYKKRMLVTTENNLIHLFSYYLGNLIFLLCSYKVANCFNIINSGFISTSNSNKFAIVLEDISTGKVDILIIKINKLFDTENLVSIKTKMTDPKANSIDSGFNKKLIEKFMNSPNCSDNYSDLSDKGNSEELVVSRHYDDGFLDEYMIFNKKNYLKGEFNKDISLLKYGYYSFELKLLINDDSSDIYFTKISDYYIYIYSEKECVIKVYKIKPNLKTFSCAYRIDYKLTIKAYQTIFPSKSNMFIFDGIFLTKYTCGQLTLEINFNELYNKKDIEILKFTKIYYYEVKLEKASKDNPIKNAKVCNFIITGLCVKKKEETQFMSHLSFEDTCSDKIDYKYRIKTLAISTPEVCEISYGPFSNGPIVICHVDGSLVVWDGLDMVISKKIQVFKGTPISKLIHEANNLTICYYERIIKSIHIIGKETEHFYNEDQSMGLQRLVRQINKYN